MSRAKNVTAATLAKIDAAWREAEAKLQTAAAAFTAASSNRLAATSADAREALMTAEINWRQADDAEAEARLATAKAIDAHEHAEGVPDVVAFEPSAVLAALEANSNEEARLMAELTAVRAARPKIVDDARDACARVGQRREAEGLPAPALWNALAPTDVAEVKSRLERYVLDGYVPRKNHSGKLARLEQDRRELRIHIEAVRQKRDKEERDAADHRAWLAQERKLDADKARAKAAAQAAENAQHVAEADALERAFVKRQAGGA